MRAAWIAIVAAIALAGCLDENAESSFCANHAEICTLGVYSVQPNAGPTAGGTVVTVSGTAFEGALVVKVDGVPVTPSNVTLTSLQLTMPPHAAGTVEISVQGDRGPGTTAYTYAGTPAVTQATPPTLDTAGGTTVDLIGSELATVTSVTFGGIAATSVQVVDGGHLQVVAPPHSAGSASILVTTAGGSTVAGPVSYVAWTPGGPIAASTILAIAKQGNRVVAGLQGLGVLTTADGTSWVTGTLDGASLDPVLSVGILSDSHLYAGSFKGFVESFDGGATWTQVPGFTVPTIVNAILIYQGTVVVASGNTMFVKLSGQPDFVPSTLPAGQGAITCLYVDRATDAFYACSQSGAVRSTSSGQDWTPVGPAVAVHSLATTTNGTASQLFIATDTDVRRVDPTIGSSLQMLVPGSAQRLVATMGTVVAIQQSGAAWRSVTQGNGAWDPLPSLPAGISLTEGFIDGSTSIQDAYFGSSGYGWYHLRIDAATPTWDSLGTIRDAPVLGPIAVGADGTVYAAERSRGIFRSTDGAKTWSVTGLGVASIYQVVAHPQLPAVVLAATSEGLFRSTDSGATFQGVSGLPVGTFFGLSAATTVPHRIYATNGTDVFMSSDDGATFSAINPPPIGASSIQSVATTNDSQHLYVVTSTDAMLVTTNGGTTWTTASNVPTASRGAILVGDPTVNNLFIAAPGGLWLTTSSGASYASVLPGNVCSVSQPLLTSSRVYASCDAQVAVSTTRGAAFPTTIQSGLPSNRFVGVQVDPTNDRHAYVAVNFDRIYRTLTGGE